MSFKLSTHKAGSLNEKLMNTHPNEKDAKTMCRPERPCKNCELKEDFFSINWGLRGLSRMTSKERVEDDMNNPLE